MLTTPLSESLVHVMFVVGLTSARHFSVALPSSVSVWFPEIHQDGWWNCTRARMCAGTVTSLFVIEAILHAIKHRNFNTFPSYLSSCCKVSKQHHDIVFPSCFTKGN